ncbi:MAG TPA: endonuclease domain-containing protein, partial [Methanosarcina sp.]|nr:endonuclease domain-containing protein [Methanosarcina sp.]
MDTQTCNKCGIEKSEVNFYLDRRRGYRNKICKSCKYATQKQNPNTLAWKAKYRESGRGREVQRRATLKRYGLTVEDYSSMLVDQGGRCAVCKKEETRTVRGVIKSLSVDHCHLSGKIRGLLCDNCNTVL